MTDEIEIGPRSSFRLQAFNKYVAKLSSSKVAVILDVTEINPFQLSTQLGDKGWSVRWYHIALDGNGNPTIFNGIPRSFEDEVARFYRETCFNSGIDSEPSLPALNPYIIATRLNFKERLELDKTHYWDYAFWQAQHQILVPAICEKLDVRPHMIEKIGISEMTDFYVERSFMDSQAEYLKRYIGEDINYFIKKHRISVHYPGMASPEAKRFIVNCVAKSLSLRPEDIFLDSGQIAPAIQASKLSPEFLDEKKNIKVAAVRNAIFDVIDHASLRVGDWSGVNSFPFTVKSEWNYDIGETPTQFRKANIRWRMVFVCTVAKAQVGIHAPNSEQDVLDIRCDIEMQFKAKSQAVRDFRPLAVIGEIGLAFGTLDGPKTDVPAEAELKSSISSKDAAYKIDVFLRKKLSVK